jgi:hypothetical protein
MLKGPFLEKGHRKPRLVVTANIAASAVEVIVTAGQILPASMRE